MEPSTWVLAPSSAGSDKRARGPLALAPHPLPTRGSLALALRELLTDGSDRALIDGILDAVVFGVSTLDDTRLSVRLQLENARADLRAQAATYAQVFVDDGLGHDSSFLSSG
jgi:hypothetical protein